MSSGKQESREKSFGDQTKSTKTENQTLNLNLKIPTLPMCKKPTATRFKTAMMNTYGDDDSLVRGQGLVSL